MSDVIDSFNRADAGSLGTADSGQTWANFGGGSLGITSNRAQTVLASTDTGSVIDGGQADATWKVTLVDPTAVSGGIVFRYVDANNFWMYMTVGGVTMNLRCRAGGVSYTVDLADAVTFAPGDVLEVVTSGNSIVAKFNGVVKRSIVDSTLATATLGGLLARPSGMYDTFSITGAVTGDPNPSPPATSNRRTRVRRLASLL